MKSAKELFEELGFKGIETEYSLIYRYMGTEIDYDCEIYFYLECKEYEFTDECTSTTVNMKLHKAITKQCEELGWL